MNNADSTDFLFRQYIGLCNYGVTLGSQCYQYGTLTLKIDKLKADPAKKEFIITALDIGGGGGIELLKRKNYLTIYISTNYNAPFYNPFINLSNWEIKELTNNNFKIKSNILGVEYRVEFARN